MAERLSMAEGTSGLGPEATPPVGEGQTGPIQPLSEITPQRPWHLSKDFDPKRTDYTSREEGIWNIYVDPGTGKEVARIVKISGGAPEESPISDLTPEEFELFLTHGYSLEELRGAKEQLGDGFREQADLQLQQIRGIDSMPVETPEQREAKRVERIKELEEEQAGLQNMPSGTDSQRRLIELTQTRIKTELSNLSHDKLSDPIDQRLEYEASPERGRQIDEEIVKWEGLRAAGKLDKVDWKKLDELYLLHTIHLEAARIISLRVNPSEPETPPPAGQNVLRVNPEALSGLRSIAELITDYEEGAIVTEAEWDNFYREVNVYFKEAQNAGLLRDLDRVLSSAWRGVRTGIGRKQNSDEIMYGLSGVPGVEQKIQVALNTVTNIFRGRQQVDLNLRSLAAIDPRTNRLVVDPQTRRITGIWDLYALLARNRFDIAIANQDIEGTTQSDYRIENEFRLGQEGDESTPRETFWRLQHGWYIEVYAETKEEFEIAADSYISRLQSITSDAKKVTQEATQFIDVLAKSEGAKRLLETNPDFINELILGIEARVGVFGADFSNEVYNGADYKAFLDFINKDAKGPDRWLTLAKLLDGKVFAALWKLDKDPRLEILFSLFGSRGQLAKMSYAQKDRATDQGLFNQVYNLFIEEMMGVQMINKADVGELTKNMSDGKLVRFFDGLHRYDPERNEYGDANIRAYRAYQALRTPDGQPETRPLTRNERLGKIQLELQSIRRKILNSESLTIKRKDNLGRLLERSFNPLKDKPYELLEDAEDRALYKKAYEDAKKAVDIAFQIYGTLGEKSKRAGGVFKTTQKTDKEGKKYRYFVPIHLAEKWVQCAETLTKIQYAHLSAKERTAKVKQARDRNIAILKKDGFEAMMVDADGKPMKLKRPKEDPSKDDELGRDTDDNVIVEEVNVDFYTATHHAYGNWSGDTYDSYQEERRHLVLSPPMFAQARQIRDGKLRWEDADPVAVRLLIIDPTLRRVRRFNEDNFEDRERKLTMAAVEDSYQSHWRITRELYRAFWPKYGTPAKDIGIYYGLQDYGGFRKTVEHLRARAAEDPERFSRRGRRLLPDLQVPVAPLSEYLGQGTTGAVGVFRMMGYPVYRLCGSFALDKFAANAEVGGKLADALLGTQNNESIIVEGLLLKLTNDSDATLQEFFQKLPSEWWLDPGKQQEFCNAVRKSFNRLERYEKLLTTMESLIRNATGAQWLENVDVLTDNGELDRDIEKRFSALPAISWVSSAAGKDITRDDLANFIKEAEAIEKTTEENFNNKFNSGTDERSGIDEGSISTNTGSGRHSARSFHDTFFEVFLDHGKRGGYKLYPTERFIYEHLKDIIIYLDTSADGGVSSTETNIIDWLFSKFVPT